MAKFQIDVVEGAVAEIAALPAFMRKQVVEAIETQLLHEPNVQTRNRKLLRGVVPPWEHLDPRGRFESENIVFSTMWTKLRLWFIFGPCGTSHHTGPRATFYENVGTD